MKTTPQNHSFNFVHPPRVLIVSATFYPELSAMQLMGAKAVFDKVGAQIVEIEVAGALEIPQALSFCLQRAEDENEPFDLALGFGVVVRGETYHFEIVSNESAHGIAQAALMHETPISNGVLTVETYAQALERADPKQLNKGGEAAIAALMTFQNCKLKPFA